MITLRSYIAEEFVAGQAPGTPLFNPATEERIAEASSAGLDLRRAVEHARAAGGPSLRHHGFAERARILQAASKALHEVRDELIGIAVENGGNTRGDAKFDIDGAIGTLSAYAALGEKLGAAARLRDGEGVQPTRSARLWGEHLWAPRLGVAVHINAFNFPAWGLFEKAAVAWLAGMPVIAKPATATALLAVRMVEVLAHKQVLPPGALQLIAGGAGDLLEHLGDQDVLAFTGSGETARMLRRHAAVVERGVRLNVEADSLNAALLGPDGEAGGELCDLFLQDVLRDITQKAGQKCTAIRRIFVPRARLLDVATELAERLSAQRVGNPATDGVTVGPVATRAQLDSVRRGIELLAAAPGTSVLCGGPAPLDGEGAPAGKGYFVRPTLLRCDRPSEAEVLVLHRHEVFGPVATIMAYEDAAQAIELVRRGGGGLVASIYSDDRAFVPAVAQGLLPYHGRLFLGSSKLAGQSPGPGTALPQLNHGGPGHAGDGHELGGARGLEFYMQRCAVLGYKPVVEGLLPLRAGAE